MIKNTRENPFVDPTHPFQILHVEIYQIGPALCQHQYRLLLGSSLFCCPSIFPRALRAAIVAAELPLRGKLRAEATTFSIDQRILEVFYQCLRALFVQGLILSCQARIAPCSTRG